MKLLVEQIKVPIDVSDNEIFEIAKARIMGTRAFSYIGKCYIYKRSVDARKKDDIKFVCTVCAEAECHFKSLDTERMAKYGIKAFSDNIIDFTLKTEMPKNPPLIVGFGPCGMFCALALARAGLKPIVIERGDDIDTRVKCVDKFYSEKILDTNSNIQFGAGGAGTFSDGKLTTRINDPKCQFVLETFYMYGAPQNIMFEAKPHIGTDNLRNIVKNIDKEITSLGGKIMYRTKLLSFNDGIAHTTNGDISYSSIVLALGHSARDTYAYLMDSGFAIEPKAFSVGVRIEHLQSELNYAMHGKNAEDKRLPNADYNVSYRENGKGVYSFCMCPGGEVVAGASEEGGICVNGMSRYARDGINANSAIAVQVDKEDYGSTPEKAIEFQRQLEKKAFSEAGGNYSAPCQTLKDFYEGKAKNTPSKIIPSYMNGNVKICDINRILPKFVCDYLKVGIRKFGEKIDGFDADCVPITGVETRTSAPVRILRNQNYTAFAHPNVYPCGEGAGYAGGIMSAAVDGLNVAIAILNG